MVGELVDFGLGAGDEPWLAQGPDVAWVGALCETVEIGSRAIAGVPGGHVVDLVYGVEDDVAPKGFVEIGVGERRPGGGKVCAETTFHGAVVVCRVSCLLRSFLRAGISCSTDAV